MNVYYLLLEVQKVREHKAKSRTRSAKSHHSCHVKLIARETKPLRHLNYIYVSFLERGGHETDRL